MSEAWGARIARYETGQPVAVSIRLRNRRVRAARCRNGDVVLRWVRLSEGLPITTEVRLSDEAALATVAVILRLPPLKGQAQ